MAEFFVVGAAKTGTTTLASILRQGGLRCRHEPMVTATTRIAAGKISGLLPSSIIKPLIRARNNYLGLDVEASHPLGYLVPELAELYPDARFIITIRDPGKWLRSRLSFHYYTDPGRWRFYRKYFWGRHGKVYHSEEKCLEVNGLYPVENYLKQYSEEYKVIFGTPGIRERSLIIETERINESISELERFVSPPESLVPLHENRRRGYEDPLEWLPESFVDGLIEKHCSWLYGYIK